MTQSPDSSKRSPFRYRTTWRHTEATAHCVASKRYAYPLTIILALTLCLSGCTDEGRTGQPPAQPGQISRQTVPHQSYSSARVDEPKPLPNRSSVAAPKKENPRKGSAAATASPVQKVKYLAGEDPEFARQKGWPVKYPDPLPGSILPNKRIVAYYGNPLSKRMGVLGEYRKDVMLSMLKREVSRWQAADPLHPVQPALHLIAVVAQGAPGKAGKYRMVMPDALVNQVYGWAKEANALLFIDIQTGHENIRTILPRFESLLKNPDVHLGIDPEFNLIKSGAKPGSKIGTYDGADVNYASGYLKDLVKKYNLPPKVLVVHRFTRNGLTNSRAITLRPEVQIVINMDGWGAPWLKRDSYKAYVVSEPVQFTGFKLFYHNDTKKGDSLMKPQDLLKLNPKPLYIQYQ